MLKSIFVQMVFFLKLKIMTTSIFNEIKNNNVKQKQNEKFKNECSNNAIISRFFY